MVHEQISTLPHIIPKLKTSTAEGRIQSVCLRYDFDVTLYELLGLYSPWKNKNILITKITIFNSNVNSVLLYGCETRKMTTQIRNKLQTLVDQYL